MWPHRDTQPWGRAAASRGNERNSNFFLRLFDISLGFSGRFYLSIRFFPVPGALTPALAAVPWKLRIVTPGRPQRLRSISACSRRDD